MGEISIRFRMNMKTGKKDIYIDFESDEDAMRHEHEKEHKKIIERLVGAGLLEACEAGGAIVERAPHSWSVSEGLFVSHAGATRDEIERTLGAVCNKSRLPEALRLAHLIGAAIVKGQSRGRP